MYQPKVWTVSWTLRMGFSISRVRSPTPGREERARVGSSGMPPSLWPNWKRTTSPGLMSARVSAQ